MVQFTLSVHLFCNVTPAVLNHERKLVDREAFQRWPELVLSSVPHFASLSEEHLSVILYSRVAWRDR